uniref:TSA: Wollemia nobilis Ref_Wollemi_Transcript_26035_1627 transcribed RNA sequence n=1 Tax=Wollemia nobilis TaxID=56998 RepID=A0A0C9RGQ2_9CONI
MEAAPKRVLTPAVPKEILRSEGGSYHVWLSSDVSMLAEGRIGAAKLILNHLGLSLPKFSDSSKVCYVLGGSGIVGIHLPEAESERVLKVKRGDTIAVPLGVVSWWFNDNPLEHLEVLFLGDTSKGHRLGEFTDFNLVGRSGLFHGFSKEFVSRAWDLNVDEVDHLLGSQSGTGIIKLKEGTSMPAPEAPHNGGGDKLRLVFNCEEAKLDVDVKNGGRVVVLTNDYLPILGDIGLGADLVKIDAHAMCSPGFSSDSAFQVTYIARGSGRVQVVGIDGERVLETELKAGCLFIVPRFHVVSKIAGDEGMEWFSIITKANPVFCNLAGRTSVWKALSKEIIAASFNVDEKTEEMVRSKRSQEAVFFPPPK